MVLSLPPFSPSSLPSSLSQSPSLLSHHLSLFHFFSPLSPSSILRVFYFLTSFTFSLYLSISCKLPLYSTIFFIFDFQVSVLWAIVAWNFSHTHNLFLSTQYAHYTYIMYLRMYAHFLGISCQTMFFFKFCSYFFYIFILIYSFFMHI